MVDGLMLAHPSGSSLFFLVVGFIFRVAVFASDDLLMLFWFQRFLK